MARTFINPELESLYKESPQVLRRLTIKTYKYRYSPNLILKVLQLKPFFSEVISFHCDDVRDDAKDIETFNRL